MIKSVLKMVSVSIILIVGVLVLEQVNSVYGSHDNYNKDDERTDFSEILDQVNTEFDNGPHLWHTETESSFLQKTSTSSKPTFHVTLGYSKQKRYRKVWNLTATELQKRFAAESKKNGMVWQNLRFAHTEQDKWADFCLNFWQPKEDTPPGTTPFCTFSIHFTPDTNYKAYCSKSGEMQQKFLGDFLGCYCEFRQNVKYPHNSREQIPDNEFFLAKIPDTNQYFKLRKKSIEKSQTLKILKIIELEPLNAYNPS